MTALLTWHRFEDLAALDLHDLLRLRQAVFVVEQACAFAEIDGRDPEAEHLVAHACGELVGCLRLLAEPDEAMRIGRVATVEKVRGTGLGHRLMREALSRCEATASGRPIHLSAQAHLQAFYAAHGFTIASDAYLEDGIPHLDMIRRS